ncbi:hypothetical protein V8E51_009051 [Hyaloscypha variabilis]
MDRLEFAWKLIFLLLGIFSLVALILAMVATSTDLPLAAFISEFVPHRGYENLQDGIKCYGLPYGAIGFTSHILTYSTIFALDSHRSPLKSILKLCGSSLKTDLNRPLIDFTFALASLILTVAASALSMVRCRNKWPLVLIAMWKMLLGLSLNFTAAHRALDVRRVNKGPDTITRKHRLRWWLPDETFQIPREHSPLPALWILVYAIGIAIGFAGLAATIAQTWHTHTQAMLIITLLFAVSLLPLSIVGGCVGVCLGGQVGPNTGRIVGFVAATFGFILSFGFLAALYSDWMLAAIEVQNGGSWAGLPDVTARWLYWTYFFSKRLPMLSV